MKTPATDRPLGWGILSTARIARRLIPAINSTGRSRVVAVASRDEKRARDFAARWEIPRSFPSYEELLESPEVSAVYLPLPNSLHCEWAVRAAAAGKHLLVEKPLALSPAEVGRIAAAAEKYRVKILEAYAYRAHPQFLKLLELVGKGAVGRPKLVRARYCFTLGAGETNIRWNKELGGGALWDVGCYPVSFARAVAGEPAEAAFMSLRAGKIGVDVLGAGQLRFPDGLLAQIECGYSLSYGVGAEVVGENGTLILPNPWQPDVDGKRNGLLFISPDDKATPLDFPPIDPYLCEAKALEGAILDGRPLPWTLAESGDVIAAVAALHLSARTGASVKLSEIDT